MDAQRQQRSRRRWGFWGLAALLLLSCLFLVDGAILKDRSTSASISEPNESAAYLNRAGEPSPPDHNHPAFGERTAERRRMVARQIIGRRIEDPNVLRAMRTVPRHAFVPKSVRDYAYADHPLPIGYDQTISQPYIVAFMTETLQLDPNATVLEIGTGSGYQAAVCAEICRAVYTIEIVEPLARSSARQLGTLGYGNVFVKAGDGYYGWPEKAPFDAIIGTAAAERIPPPLIKQLKQGGRMILPVEGEGGLQSLVLMVKDERGRVRQEKVLPVRFVPMTGQVQKPAEKDEE